MDFPRQVVNLLRERRVELQVLLRHIEFMVRLRLLELSLAVLPDQHERRKEDCLERGGQRQRRPWASLDEQHPTAKQREMQVHELHRADKRGDAVGNPQLGIVGAFRVDLDDDGMAGLAHAEPSGAMRRLMAGVGVSP